MTKKLVKDLGVDVDSITFSDLADVLKDKAGEYFHVTVKTNGAFRNTYVQGPARGGLPAADVKEQASRAPVTVPDVPLSAVGGRWLRGLFVGGTLYVLIEMGGCSHALPEDLPALVAADRALETGSVSGLTEELQQRIAAWCTPRAVFIIGLLDRPDAVALDLGMPVDGVELLRFMADEDFEGPVLIKHGSLDSVCADPLRMHDALQRILLNHRRRWAGQSRRLARRLSHLGCLEFRLGDRTASRRTFASALRVDPFSLATHAMFWSSLLGGRAMRLSQRYWPKHAGMAP